MAETTCRIATADDLPRLRELEQQLIESERPYDAALKEADVTYYDMQHLLTDSKTQLLVVELAADAVGEHGTATGASAVIGCGYIQIRESRDCHIHDVHGYLGFIYVDAAHRGQGVARLLIDSLRQWGVSQGLQEFQLDVYTANAAAIRAYQKVGFAPATVKMVLSG